MQPDVAGLDASDFNIDQWPKYGAYKPIDFSKKVIRLIELSRSIEPDSLACKFLYKSLDDKPEYNALSYYWGAPSVLGAIRLDGEVVYIRQNLRRFLESLTARLSTTIIWLDALCINQEDVEERNWQVSLMQDIYESAQNVYAWLGEGDADCKYCHGRRPMS